MELLIKKLFIILLAFVSFNSFAKEVVYECNSKINLDFFTYDSSQNFYIVANNFGETFYHIERYRYEFMINLSPISGEDDFELNIDAQNYSGVLPSTHITLSTEILELNKENLNVILSQSEVGVQSYKCKHIQE